MTISEVEAHSRAVVSLQVLLSKHCPGSSPYCIAERALDLAFNWPRASSAISELELLAEAESLIERQVRSKLIAAPFPHLSPAYRRSERAPARPCFLARPGSVRRRVTEQLGQVELWLTPEVRRGDGHAVMP